MRKMKVATPQDLTDLTDDDNAILVCARPSIENAIRFPDNVKTFCHQCKRSIVHRPNVPPIAIKLCTDCAEEHTDEREQAGEDVTVYVTEKSLREAGH